MSYQTETGKIAKRIAAFVLTVGMIVTVLPFAGSEVFAASNSSIESPSKASGASYTSSAALAAKLDKVFAGNIGLSRSTSFKSTVKAPLGSTLMTSRNMFYIKSGSTGATTSGWQCFIYANAVYNTLFNEYIGRASSLRNSKVLLSGGNKASYDQFTKAGIKCGAYMRTTTKSNGAYNGSAGHSLIVLSYNANSITYLEGNADGHGLVRIMTRTWSNFNSNQLSGKSRYICHVVQPNEKYYNSLYGASSGGSETVASTTAKSSKTTTTTATTTTTTAAASTKVSFSRTLSYQKQMMNGSDVTYVQNCLNTLGYTVKVTGKYDSETSAAVKKFQSANSISADGKVGSGTWKALEKAVAAKTTTAKTTTTTVKTTTTTKAAAIQITQQPKNASGKLGTKVSFTVKATGKNLKYQWQYSDNNGKTWNNTTIKNLTTTYTTTVKNYSSNKRQIRCVITDGNGNKVISNAAVMSVKK